MSSAVEVLVYGPNLKTQNEALHVHRPGCADTRKAVYRGHRALAIKVESFTDLVTTMYDPGDFDYDPDTELDYYSADIRVFPCVKLEGY